MKSIDVRYMMPDIINPAPLNEYYVGCSFCSNDNVMHVAIFNKTTNCFEYTTKLFTTNKNDADLFAEALAKYFNGTLIKEVQ